MIFLVCFYKKYCVCVFVLSIISLQVCTLPAMIPLIDHHIISTAESQTKTDDLEHNEQIKAACLAARALIVLIQLSSSSLAFWSSRESQLMNNGASNSTMTSPTIRHFEPYGVEEPRAALHCFAALIFPKIFFWYSG